MGYPNLQPYIGPTSMSQWKGTLSITEGWSFLLIGPIYFCWMTVGNDPMKKAINATLTNNHTYCQKQYY